MWLMLDCRASGPCKVRCRETFREKLVPKAGGNFLALDWQQASEVGKGNQARCPCAAEGRKADVGNEVFYTWVKPTTVGTCLASSGVSGKFPGEWNSGLGSVCRLTSHHSGVPSALLALM